MRPVFHTPSRIEEEEENDLPMDSPTITTTVDYNNNNDNNNSTRISRKLFGELSTSTTPKSKQNTRRPSEYSMFDETSRKRIRVKSTVDRDQKRKRTRIQPEAKFEENAPSFPRVDLDVPNPLAYVPIPGSEEAEEEEIIESQRTEIQEEDGEEESITETVHLGFDKFDKVVCYVDSKCFICSRATKKRGCVSLEEELEKNPKRNQFRKHVPCPHSNLYPTKLLRAGSWWCCRPCVRVYFGPMSMFMKTIVDQNRGLRQELEKEKKEKKEKDELQKKNEDLKEKLARRQRVIDRLLEEKFQENKKKKIDLEDEEVLDELVEAMLKDLKADYETELQPTLSNVRRFDSRKYIENKKSFLFKIFKKIVERKNIEEKWKNKKMFQVATLLSVAQSIVSYKRITIPGLFVSLLMHMIVGSDLCEQLFNICGPGVSPSYIDKLLKDEEEKYRIGKELPDKDNEYNLVYIFDNIQKLLKTSRTSLDVSKLVEIFTNMGYILSDTKKQETDNCDSSRTENIKKLKQISLSKILKSEEDKKTENDYLFERFTKRKEEIVIEEAKTGGDPIEMYGSILEEMKVKTCEDCKKEHTNLKEQNCRGCGKKMETKHDHQIRSKVEQKMFVSLFKGIKENVEKKFGKEHEGEERMEDEEIEEESEDDGEGESVGESEDEGQDEGESETEDRISGNNNKNNIQDVNKNSTSRSSIRNRNQRSGNNNTNASANSINNNNRSEKKFTKKERRTVRKVIRIIRGLAVNPSSKKNCKKILNDFEDLQKKISQKIMYIIADGSPISQLINVIMEDEDIRDNLYLLNGHFHTDQELHRLMFSLVAKSIPDLLRSMEWNSKRQFYFLEKCSDFHKAYEVSEVIFESLLSELIVDCSQREKVKLEDLEYQQFYCYVTNAKTERPFVYLLFHYLLLTQFYHSAIRKGNSSHLLSIKRRIYPYLFFFNCHVYKKIFAFEFVDRSIATEPYQVLDDASLLPCKGKKKKKTTERSGNNNRNKTKSGSSQDDDISESNSRRNRRIGNNNTERRKRRRKKKYDSADGKFEEENKWLKKLLGVPTLKKWMQCSKNIEVMKKIRKLGTKLLNLKDSESRPKITHIIEVLKARNYFRSFIKMEFKFYENIKIDTKKKTKEGKKIMRMKKVEVVNIFEKTQKLAEEYTEEMIECLEKGTKMSKSKRVDFVFSEVKEKEKNEKKKREEVRSSEEDEDDNKMEDESGEENEDGEDGSIEKMEDDENDDVEGSEVLEVVDEENDEVTQLADPNGYSEQNCSEFHEPGNPLAEEWNALKRKDKYRVEMGLVKCGCDKGFKGLDGVCRCDYSHICGEEVEVHGNEKKRLATYFLEGKCGAFWKLDQGHISVCYRCLSVMKCCLCEETLVDPNKKSLEEEGKVITDLIDYCANPKCSKLNKNLHIQCSEHKIQTMDDDGKEYYNAYCSEQCYKEVCGTFVIVDDSLISHKIKTFQKK